MKTKTNVKAGIVKLLDAATPKLVNHNQSTGMPVNTRVKAGLYTKQKADGSAAPSWNHNQTQVRTTDPAGLRVKTSVKAGRTLTPPVPTGMVIKWS